MGFKTRDKIDALHQFPGLIEDLQGCGEKSWDRRGQSSSSHDYSAFQITVGHEKLALKLFRFFIQKPCVGIATTKSA
jgi:hypothetical protein